ncbi:hypothetical protein TeGR_g5310 [Tetraparma gracilis]|uniref:Uncharacterized protein n=1 Tax=Tetraparma gracilis TaxID=2962635 RepID=A0ABQ6M821_9STRA|nr:hypothetical protein TeGR_g5310 [Tetraparma gracilis]
MITIDITDGKQRGSYRMKSGEKLGMVMYEFSKMPHGELSEAQRATYDSMLCLEHKGNFLLHNDTVDALAAHPGVKDLLPYFVSSIISETAGDIGVRCKFTTRCKDIAAGLHNYPELLDALVPSITQRTSVEHVCGGLTMLTCFFFGADFGEGLETKSDGMIWETMPSLPVPAEILAAVVQVVELKEGGAGWDDHWGGLTAGGAAWLVARSVAADLQLGPPDASRVFVPMAAILSMPCAYTTCAALAADLDMAATEEFSEIGSDCILRCLAYVRQVLQPHLEIELKREAEASSAAELAVA